jgi:hypothetical protein
MFRMLQHGREAKEVSMHRLVHHNFLLVFVGGGEPHGAGHHHISVIRALAGFVDALASRKSPHLNASRQNLCFVIV